MRILIGVIQVALYPNKPPASSFAGILNTVSNGQLTNVLQVIQDGIGNNSPLSLSQVDLKINTTMGGFYINDDVLQATAVELNNSSAGNFSNFTSSLRLPVGTNAQRPAVPQNGDIRYNSSTNQLEVYKGGAWKNVLTT